MSNKMLEASQNLLINALDSGIYGPGMNVDNPDYKEEDWEGYHIDADGDLWYNDWWEFNKWVELEEEHLNKLNNSIATVLTLAESKWIRKIWKKKLTNEEIHAIRMVSQYVEHCILK